jgi:hypothetical protein
MIRQPNQTEVSPLAAFVPEGPASWTVLWIDPRGKEALFEASSSEAPPKPSLDVKRLLDAGAAVVGIDLLFQGEFLNGREAPSRARKVENPREAAAYSFGYNHTLFARRTHDVLRAVAGLKDPRLRHELAVARQGRLAVVGLAGAGHWVAAARAVAGASIDAAIIDTQGFRFGAVPDIYSVDFLPGGAQYFDLPGMVALGEPGRLLLAGEGASPSQLGEAGIVARAFAWAGTAAKLDLVEFPSDVSSARKTAVDWLLSVMSE